MASPNEFLGIFRFHRTNPFQATAFHTLRRASCEAGFTLVEMLAVVGIVGVLLVLLVPAFTSMSTSNTVTSEANSIKGVLENARTYAKANHTYVFVGIAEVDVSVDPLLRPQVTTGAVPYGRIAVAMVASRDGSRHFDYRTASQGLDWRNGYDNGANLMPVGKLEVFENLHFIGLNFGSWTPTSHPNSSMARYQISGYNIGTLNSVTPFSWPLGSSLDDGYQYRFDKVIIFDPRGVARVATATNADEVTDRIEIDFQQSRGTVTPTPPTNQDVGNHFVIQIDAPTSAVRLYRP
jgi:prepilin-type N-terminal cleavage/methylation domain-containing protein